MHKHFWTAAVTLEMFALLAASGSQRIWAQEEKPTETPVVGAARCHPGIPQ